MSKKIKILFFHNSLPEYRIGWFKSLNELSEIKFVITNESLAVKNYGYKIKSDELRDLNLHFITKKYSVRELKTVLNEIPKFDFVELPPIDSFYDYIISFLILFICRKNDIKIGYFWEKWEAPKKYQSLRRKIKNYILRIVPRSIYSKVDIIFSPGRKNKDYFLDNGVNVDKIKFIPNSSEVRKCRPKDIKAIYNIPKSNKLILFLGRVLEQKGVDILIEAYLRLDKNLMDSTTLLIAGDGEFLEYCKEKYQNKNIVYTGRVNPDERYNFYSQCDIFVYPVTHRFGWVDVWGLTLNEALQFDKLIVATDAVGSAYELIDENINGYISKAGDIDDLSEKIKKSLYFKDRKCLLKKSSELKQIYNYRNMGIEYIKYINKLIEK
ncbi:glycosyltransferase family 4 protein [Enterococcus cecorum]|uniref:glycosyltransferase family 4 protein n=1 Tax=Enterococcus cecorum TaxID=44008 RepID=UPI0032C42ED9